MYFIYHLYIAENPIWLPEEIVQKKQIPWYWRLLEILSMGLDDWFRRISGRNKAQYIWKAELRFSAHACVDHERINNCCFYLKSYRIYHKYDIAELKKKSHQHMYTVAFEFSRISSYNASINPRTANFDVQYGTKLFSPQMPATDEIAIMCPRDLASICGKNASSIQNWPNTLTSNVLRISSSVCCSSGREYMTPALFTMTET